MGTVYGLAVNDSGNSLKGKGLPYSELVEKLINIFEF